MGGHGAIDKFQSNMSRGTVTRGVIACIKDVGSNRGVRAPQLNI